MLHISYFDGIDPNKANRFMQFCTAAIHQHRPDGLYIHFASGGGDVDSGFVLYNYLTSLQGQMPVVMHNTGTVDSIANVVFLGARERYAAPNASFLFHGVSMNFNGAQNGTMLREALSRMEGMEQRIAATIMQHTALSLPELRQLFAQGQSKNVDFALEKGVIQAVRNPTIPVGATHLVFGA
jgi:ATP-dependent Clp protease protease subunit